MKPPRESTKLDEGLIYEIQGSLQEDHHAVKARPLVCKPVDHSVGVAG